MKVLSTTSMIMELVELAIETEDYAKINEAENLAIENEIPMYFEEGQIMVEDELFYLPESMM